MTQVTKTYYLGIGSNVNRKSNIRSALNYLACSFSTFDTSPVYQSAAFGFEGQDFYNLVVKIETVFTPNKLKSWLQKLEDLHGRDRSQPKYSNRTLDIDLLLCDDWVIDDGTVQIPRREILKRKYVLKPLQDMAPDVVHPVAQKRLADLWQALEKQSGADLDLVTDDFITNDITSLG